MYLVGSGVPRCANVVKLGTCGGRERTKAMRELRVHCALTDDIIVAIIENYL